MITRLDHTNSLTLFEKYDFLQAFFFFLHFFRLYKRLKEIEGNNDLDFSLPPPPPALCALRPELFLSIHHNTIIIIIIC